MSHMDKKFFVYCGIILVLSVTLAKFISSEFVTSFSQNIVKTTGAVYACIFILYSFIVLYRFLKKGQGLLLLTLKELILNVTFLVSVYNLALLSDQVLIYAERDLDAVPSNIFAFILIAVFFCFQWFLLGKWVGLRPKLK